MTKKKVIRSNVFALSNEEFILKLDKLSFSKNIHIDYMDSKFTKNRTPNFDVMSRILNYNEKIDFQLHFMGLYPQVYIEDFLKIGIKKVLIHYEAFEFETEIITAIDELKDAGIQVGLVINPQTEIEKTYKFLDKLYAVLLMSVIPGAQNQKFEKSVLKKVENLNHELETRNLSELEIQIDGGVNLDNVDEIFNSGVDSVNIGSCISDNIEPKKIYNNFVKISKKYN